MNGNFEADNEKARSYWPVVQTTIKVIFGTGIGGHVPVTVTAASFVTENAPKCIVSRVNIFLVTKSPPLTGFQPQIPPWYKIENKTHASNLFTHFFSFSCNCTVIDPINYYAVKKILETDLANSMASLPVDHSPVFLSRHGPSTRLVETRARQHGPS